METSKKGFSMYVGSMMLLVEKDGIEFSDLITLTTDAPTDFLAMIECFNIATDRAIKYTERGYLFKRVYSVNICEFGTMRPIIAGDLDEIYSIVREQKNGI